MTSTTKIGTLEPIIFYSGKQDELHFFLNETEFGELIIISLSDDQLFVREVLLEETNEKLEWKQDHKELRISVPEGLQKKRREYRACIEGNVLVGSPNSIGSSCRLKRSEEIYIERFLDCVALLSK